MSGPGGTVGNALAGKATPDGYTWLMTATWPHVIAPSYYRSLATGGSTRTPLAPELPPVAGLRLPGFEDLVWYGLLGPTGMPDAVVRMVNAEISRLLNLEAQFKRDYDEWAMMMKSAGIRQD